MSTAHRAPLPSMEAWSIVWVWSTLLTLRQHARRLRNIAAAVEKLQHLRQRLAIKTVHEIAPVFLKDEGRIEALFTLYAIALLVQALIERELRQAMARDGVDELPIYPEQRQCAHPTTEQVLRLFGLAERHHLLQHGHTVQTFPLKLTDLQRHVLALLGVPASAF